MDNLETCGQFVAVVEDLVECEREISCGDFSFNSTMKLSTSLGHSKNRSLLHPNNHSNIIAPNLNSNPNNNSFMPADIRLSQIIQQKLSSHSVINQSLSNQFFSHQFLLNQSPTHQHHHPQSSHSFSASLVNQQPMSTSNLTAINHKEVSSSSYHSSQNISKLSFIPNPKDQPYQQLLHSITQYHDFIAVNENLSLTNQNVLPQLNVSENPIPQSISTNLSFSFSSEFFVPSDPNILPQFTQLPHSIQPTQPIQPIQPIQPNQHIPDNQPQSNQLFRGASQQIQALQFLQSAQQINYLNYLLAHKSNLKVQISHRYQVLQQINDFHKLQINISNNFINNFFALDLSYVQFKMNQFLSLDWKNLTVLDLEGCNIDDQGFRQLSQKVTKFTYLTQIFLSHNNIKVIQQGDLNPFCELKYLKILNLGMFQKYADYNEQMSSTTRQLLKNKFQQKFFLGFTFQHYDHITGLFRFMSSEEVKKTIPVLPQSLIKSGKAFRELFKQLIRFQRNIKFSDLIDLIKYVIEESQKNDQPINSNWFIHLIQSSMKCVWSIEVDLVAISSEMEKMSDIQENDPNLKLVETSFYKICKYLFLQFGQELFKLATKRDFQFHKGVVWAANATKRFLNIGFNFIENAEGIQFFFDQNSTERQKDEARKKFGKLMNHVLEMFLLFYQLNRNQSQMQKPQQLIKVQV